MILTKVTDKSLVTNQDLSFNHRLGIPVEVFCLKERKTVAFGQMSHFNDQLIVIQGKAFLRSQFLFFGHPSLEETS
ncbi:hypothetical protein [Bacillus suaedae]|uniref:Uncharacterized protein n=1 Tax=Halalkalibacter suaedae TaxID=2822140 RepID=A0A940WTW1_9BACI|nr:hypothetical protein [Bacillus suaedae]MBP3950552.1 hypothetical protein [Bacillus suaedae]